MYDYTAPGSDTAPAYKEIVEQHEAGGIKTYRSHVPAKRLPKKAKGASHFFFAVQVAGDEEKQPNGRDRQSHGKITAVSENDRNDADSFYNIPVGERDCVVGFIK